MGRVHIDGALPPRGALVIYGLMDGDEVRYVGRTSRLRPRMNEHVTHAAIPGHQGNDDLGRWVLQQNPLVVRVLQVVEEGDGAAAEARWIGAFPNLLNVSPGFNRAADGSNGRRGQRQSEATRRKRSESMKAVRAVKHWGGKHAT